ncbi:BID domain-containing T4SS effector [Bartonella sp. B39]
MKKKHLSSFSSRTPEKTEKSHKKHAATSLNLENIQAAAMRQGSLLPKEEIIDKVRCSPLVEVYAEGIQRWSKIVYGYKDVLRTETKKILEDPAVGNSLLKRVTESPTSIHSLAGMQIFGFKTKARKNAEHALSYLCSAIDGYVKAIDYTYEGMNITTPVENKTLERSLQKSITAGKNEPSLSNEETIGLALSNSSVQEYYTQIKYWSRIVYDNPEALQKSMEDVIQNPAMGKRLLWKLKEDPASFHKLAGRSILGFKDETRKFAESRLSRLHDAFESYVFTVKEAKESILQEQEIKQKLQGGQKRQHMPQHTMQADRSAGTVAQEAVSSPKPSFSNEEIVGMIRSEPSIQRCCKLIRYWSNVVYDKPNVFEKQMESILQNPAMGEQLLQDLARNPTFLHRFVGHSILGFKDDARRCAENSLPYLQNAIKNYAQAIKEAKESILQKQKIQQERIKLSESPRQEIKQKLQRGQERQHTPQHDVQQHGARSGKRMAFAM